MNLVFAFLALVTCAAAVAAMTLRRLVHCALCLTVAFAGLAAVFLQLDAQFVGFAQILVYIGAVAVLVLFAIVLTRGGEAAPERIASSSWPVGAAIAALAFGTLAAAVLSSSAVSAPARPRAEIVAGVAVKNIGAKLMTEYVLALEVIALLLTAALIGAVIIAMRDERQ